MVLHVDLALFDFCLVPDFRQYTKLFEQIIRPFYRIYNILLLNNIK